MHTHTYTHTHVHTYSHIHTYTRTHVHTYSHIGWGWLDLLIAITGILQDFLPQCVHSQKCKRVCAYH